jgi:hypothetical protein
MEYLAYKFLKVHTRFDGISWVGGELKYKMIKVIRGVFSTTKIILRP